MTLPVFAVDSRALSADVIEVAGAEGRHATVVRRLRPGEHIVLTDGCGEGAKCVVRSIWKGTLIAEVVDRQVEAAPAPRVVVVQALIKGDAGEQAVDLMTQVGVDSIVPWAAARSVARWPGASGDEGNRRDSSGDRGDRADAGSDEHGNRGEKGLQRWRRAAQEASKQARRLRFLNVEPLHTTKQVAALLSAAEHALVLHETADAPVAEVAMPANGLVALIVGPEGGVTDDELAAFTGAGAEPVWLGPSVLRSSTAGAVGAAVLLSRTPRWRRGETAPLSAR